MMQYKARCWYFGGNLVLDIALRIGVSEPHLLLSHNRSATAWFCLNKSLIKIWSKYKICSLQSEKCCTRVLQIQYDVINYDLRYRLMTEIPIV